MTFKYFSLPTHPPNLKGEGNRGQGETAREAGDCQVTRGCGAATVVDESILGVWLGNFTLGTYLWGLKGWGYSSLGGGELLT